MFWKNQAIGPLFLGSLITSIGLSVAAKFQMQKYLKRVEEGLRMQTANGIVSSNLKTALHVKHLNVSVEAWVLDDVPLVLSLSKLIKEHGFDFQWNRCACAATFSKTGNFHHLATQKGVPLLPAT